MTDIIIAASTGEELRNMLYSKYDFEVGDEENSFLVTCLRSEWDPIPDNARIYIPGTEYGGIYRRLETNTRDGTISIGGYTWRGMLQKKILMPPAGSDYATDSGEINAIIAARVSAAFPGLFVGSSIPTGITATYQYGRYVTLYDGLKAMLKSVGYRLRIEYDQETCKVVVDAVPIVDYSQEIEYSSDMNANYFMTRDTSGINHLVCLGEGELRDRVVVHLFMDGSGNISTTQTFFGADEIAAVHDYAGAARSDLIQSGTDKLIQDKNDNKFVIELESVKDVAVGDIVGGRDYTTGMRMTAPIVTKIVTWKKGSENVEYKLSEDVNVEID